MGADSLAKNTPNASKLIWPICLPKPKSLGFQWNKASLGVRSSCFIHIRGVKDRRKEGSRGNYTGWPLLWNEGASQSAGRPPKGLCARAAVAVLWPASAGREEEEEGAKKLAQWQNTCSAGGWCRIPYITLLQCTCSRTFFLFPFFFLVSSHLPQPFFSHN